MMLCQCFDGNAKYFDMWWLYHKPLNFATLKFRDPCFIFVVVGNSVANTHK